jgi:hypothetical protein
MSQDKPIAYPILSPDTEKRIAALLEPLQASIKGLGEWVGLPDNASPSLRIAVYEAIERLRVGTNG